MLVKCLSAAVLVAVVGVAQVQAQSIGSLGGPSNLPPSGWTGQQFVDNRGCVFLKAGYGGQVNWVPRVGRDRKPMCGYPPSFGSRPKIEVVSDDQAEANAPVVVAEARPAPAAPAPVVTTRKAKAEVPVESYVPAPVVGITAPAPRQPAPYAHQAPTGGYQVAEASGGSGRQIGCYTSAPVAERVKLRSGGTAVVCTRGDGTLTGWRPPVYPAGAGVGAALTDPVIVGHAGRDGVSHSGGHYGSHQDHDAAYHAASDEIPAPPKGYVLAWKDDRLNPKRGKGTAQGQADQDQVWTRKVPAKLVAEEGKSKKKVVYVQKKTDVVVSTKGQPADAPQPKAKGGYYVQVGTFGVPANAEGALSRLSGMGLPVARGKTSSGGKALTIVLAGPFGSGSDAQAALSAARRAGFGDAFIR